MFFHCIFFLPPSIEPPFEPAVEAPAKPPLSEDEDEIEEDLSDKGHYDSLEKASPPPVGELSCPSV